MKDTQDISVGDDHNFDETQEHYESGIAKLYDQFLEQKRNTQWAKEELAKAKRLLAETRIELETLDLSIQDFVEKNAEILREKGYKPKVDSDARSDTSRERMEPDSQNIMDDERNENDKWNERSTPELEPEHEPTGSDDRTESDESDDPTKPDSGIRRLNVQRVEPELHPRVQRNSVAQGDGGGRVNRDEDVENERPEEPSSSSGPTNFQEAIATLRSSNRNGGISNLLSSQLAEERLQGRQRLYDRMVQYRHQNHLIRTDLASIRDSIATSVADLKASYSMVRDLYRIHQEEMMRRHSDF